MELFLTALNPTNRTLGTHSHASRPTQQPRSDTLVPLLNRILHPAQKSLLPPPRLLHVALTAPSPRTSPAQ
ncbi:uncharacterized [Tachysurus ichikawai]